MMQQEEFDRRNRATSRRHFLQGTLGAFFAGSILSRLTGCVRLKAAGPGGPGRTGKALAGRQAATPAGVPLPYRIGAAEADITPTWPVMMAGWSSRKKPSEGYYQKLYVRALTIDDGHNKVVYVMGDICYWDRKSRPQATTAPLNIIAAIVDQLQQGDGLDPGQILFVASHTHAGPVLQDARFKPMLIAQTVKCVREALAQAREARLFFGRGMSRVGVSRRGRDLTGEDRWEINPYAQHDDELVVLKAVDRAGKPIAAVFNYGCHPTTRGGQLLGPDFPGFAAQALRQRLGGAPALFLQGSAGDAKTNCPIPGKPFLFLPHEEATVEHPKAFGLQLAEDVCRVLDGRMEEITGSIRYASRPVELPVLAAWTSNGKRWTDAAAETDPGNPLSGPRRRMGRYARLILDSMDENGNYKETQASEIFCVRIGDSFIHVGMSGEICSPIGLRVKDQLRSCNVMFTGYTGYMHGYVPGQAQITAGGYEIFSNPHHKPYSPELEDMLLCDTMDLIQTLGPNIPDLNPPQ